MSKTITFPSKSDPSNVRTVTIDDDGQIACDCPGFQHRQKCWHADEAQERQAIAQEPLP